MSGVAYSHCSWCSTNPEYYAQINPTPYIDSSKNNWLYINPSWGRCSAIYLPNCSGRIPKSNELTIEFWVEKSRATVRGQPIAVFWSNNSSHNGWHWVGGLGTSSYDYTELSAWGTGAACDFDEVGREFSKTITIGPTRRYTGTWCGWIYITASSASEAPDLWIKKLWVNWN